MRLGLVVAGVGGLVVLAAACGAGTDPPAASRNHRATTTTAAAAPASGSTGSTAPAQSSQAQQLQLSQCMRSHGVPNFPDPPADGAMLNAIAAAGINANSPAYQAALQACRSFTQAGNLTPAQSAAHNALGLELSQCMRSHGVPNFPDPVVGPTGAQAINLGPEHIDPTSPAYQAASAACQGILPDGK